MAEDPNPYAQMYSEELKKSAPTGGGAGGALPPEPSVMANIGSKALDLAKGVGKGALGTVANIDQAARQHLPAFMTNQYFGLGKPTDVQGEQEKAQTHNGWQTVGKGLEQAGEFLIPGAGEEVGAAKLASLAPRLGKVAAPLAKTVMAGLGSGMVNKAQGGDFGTGAAAGAGGAMLGAGAKAIAPKLAESALNIGKAARGGGRDIGQAVIDETKGIRPSTIAESGKGKISSLYGERQEMLDAASSKPTPPVRGFLMPPREEVPLATKAGRNPKSSPMSFYAEVDPQSPRVQNPLTYGSRAPAEDLKYMSGSEHPELSGRVPQPQGVMLRRPEMSASIPPSVQANPSASLAGPRGILSDAMGRARGMEAHTLHGQVSSMNDFLHRGAVSGEAIPESVTPSHLGRLQQGFNDEHLRWNPDIHEQANAAGQRAYGAMTGELERTVPGTAPINRRISSLIPAVRAAESTDRNAPMAQKIVGRFAAPTGAMLSGLYGGEEGYRHGGLPGAIAGAAGGIAAPLLVATPEGQMVMARTLNHAPAMTPAFTGALLQADRKKENQ